MGKSASKLSPEQLVDLQRLTYFDKKELQQWFKGFIKDFPTGRIDRAEFQRIYRQFFPFGDPTSFANYLFAVFDRDGNDLVDFKEFICALSITSRGQLNEKLEWAFELYDLDRDGYISREEMLAVVDALYRMAGSMVKLPIDEDTAEKRVEKVFRLMDLDRDGRISMEEFKLGSEQDPMLLQALAIYDGMI